jgi:hypothetical protein
MPVKAPALPASSRRKSPAGAHVGEDEESQPDRNFHQGILGPPMLFHSYLRDGIVYVPTVAVREGGPVYTDIEPVAVVPATNTEVLRRAFLDAIARKNVVVPVPKGKWPAPVLLKYAGVRSWSAFARNASLWSIEKEGDVYQIVDYRKHAKGYWQQDPDQKIQFPAGAAVDDVVGRMVAILQGGAKMSSC